MLVTQEISQNDTSANQREKEELQEVITSLTLQLQNSDRKYEDLNILMKGITNTFGVNYIFSMLRSSLFKKRSLS